jgi:ABC-type dipeptide/oligopeptide/nickel transport system permease component
LRSIRAARALAEDAALLMFILRRIGAMILTALCLTFIVFFLTNLDPNLEKLAKEQNNARMSDVQVESWLEREGYRRPLVIRYGEWLGAVAVGDFGRSTRFDKPVANRQADVLGDGGDGPLSAADRGSGGNA